MNIKRWDILYKICEKKAKKETEINKKKENGKMKREKTKKD